MFTFHGSAFGCLFVATHRADRVHDFVRYIRLGPVLRFRLILKKLRHYLSSSSWSLPRILLALPRIRAASVPDNFPAFPICVARAFAFAAWARSGMGYAFFSGNPNVL